jgi:hypothetical protein
MKIIFSLALVAACVLAAAGRQAENHEALRTETSRQVADKPADYFGPFHFNGETPRGFENFRLFALGYKEQTDADSDNRDALVPDGQGVVAVRGQLETVKGNQLDFESVRLVESGPVTEFFARGLPPRVVRAQPVSLSFKTVEMKGVRYAFQGEYLDDPAEEDGGYTYLKGVLSKFKNGRLVAEAKAGFSLVALEGPDGGEPDGEEPSAEGQ